MPPAVARTGAPLDGWEAIDELTVLECAVVAPHVPVRRCVGASLSLEWAEANAAVLERWEAAEARQDSVAAARYLKWWWFLPQLLLRSPSRGGAAARRQFRSHLELSSRFALFRARDMCSLIGRWPTGP